MDALFIVLEGLHLDHLSLDKMNSHNIDVDLDFVITLCFVLLTYKPRVGAGRTLDCQFSGKICVCYT